MNRLLLLALACSLQLQPPGLLLGSARISVTGTSTMHDFTAITRTARVTRAEVIPLESWSDIIKPSSVTAFEIAVPVATLKSGTDGLDRNLHAALRAQEFPDIIFTLTRLEAAGTSTLRATGTMRITGVEREITVDVITELKGRALIVKGTLPLDLGDYGISAPPAMLGLMRVHRKVTITFEIGLTSAKLR